MIFMTITIIINNYHYNNSNNRPAIFLDTIAVTICIEFLQKAALQESSEDHLGCMRQSSSSSLETSRSPNCQITAIKIILTTIIMITIKILQSKAKPFFQNNCSNLLLENIFSRGNCGGGSVY